MSAELSREPNFVRRPTAELLLLVAAAIAMDVLAIRLAGLRFVNADSFLPYFGGTISLIAALSIYMRVRMPENVRMIRLVEMIGIYITMCIVMMTYQYALACAPAIPVSHLVEDLDHSVGFNWVSFSQAVNVLPFLSEALGFCYRNWMREFAVLFAALAFVRRFDDLEEFTTVYILAGMATLSVSGLLDSKSYEALNAAGSVSGLHIPSGIGQPSLEKVLALRAGLDHTMDLSQVLGLVCFPSFHAGAALLLAVYSRKAPYVWPVFAAFNIAMIIGTITEGGHNLMDVLGGLAIAVAAIAAGQALRRSGWLSRAAGALAALAPRRPFAAAPQA